jgi:hypothetical protein
LFTIFYSVISEGNFVCIYDHRWLFRRGFVRIQKHVVNTLMFTTWKNELFTKMSKIAIPVLIMML